MVDLPTTEIIEPLFKEDPEEYYYSSGSLFGSTWARMSIGRKKKLRSDEGTWLFLKFTHHQVFYQCFILF